jgi:AcrR family transcriptional regulator
VTAQLSTPIEEPFETQGERRRAQFLAIAAKLIVAGGPEAVTHVAVAERASVVRASVYRYFPTRDDLLAAVLSGYLTLHRERITAENVVAGVLALARATPRRVPPATRLMLEKLWDPQDWSTQALELRLATVILQRDAELLARLHTADPDLASQEITELSGPLGQLGLSAIEIRIVTEAMLGAQYHATSAALAGGLDRDEAMRITYRMSLAAVQAYLD